MKDVPYGKNNYGWNKRRARTCRVGPLIVDAITPILPTKWVRSSPHFAGMGIYCNTSIRPILYPFKGNISLKAAQ